MGGAPCLIIIQALVRYKTVPKSDKDRKEMEAQLRSCYANPTIADAAGEDEIKAMQICETLEKTHLSPEDLQFLRNALPAYVETVAPPGG